MYYIHIQPYMNSSDTSIAGKPQFHLMKRSWAGVPIAKRVPGDGGQHAAVGRNIISGCLWYC